MLFERDEIDAKTSELTDEHRYVLSHMVAVAALLIAQREQYPQLLAQHREGGAPGVVSENAHEFAERAAAVLQSARRRSDLLAAFRDTPLNPLAAIAVLDQLFFSFCLLTNPDDSLVDAVLGEATLDELLKAMEFDDWLNDLGLKQ